MTHTAPILVAEIDVAMLDSDHTQLEDTPPQPTPQRWSCLDNSAPGGAWPIYMLIEAALRRGSIATKSDPGVAAATALTPPFIAPALHPITMPNYRRRHHRRRHHKCICSLKAAVPTSKM